LDFLRSEFARSLDLRGLHSLLRTRGPNNFRDSLDLSLWNSGACDCVVSQTAHDYSAKSATQYWLYCALLADCGAAQPCGLNGGVRSLDGGSAALILYAAASVCRLDKPKLQPG
jgi:hypothetical protein